jgi:hypothetical protein
MQVKVVCLRHYTLHTEPRVLCSVLQGIEQWQQTDLAASVKLFQTQFLDQCQKSNRSEFSNKSKAAAVMTNAVLAY